MCRPVPHPKPDPQPHRAAAHPLPRCAVRSRLDERGAMALAAEGFVKGDGAGSMGERALNSREDLLGLMLEPHLG